MHDSARPKRLTPSLRPRLLAAAALASAVLVAATTSTSPASAAAATASRSSATTTPPKGSPAQLLVEWANCMRSQGDPNQADPTITVNKLIDIPWNPAIPGGYCGTYKGGQANSGSGQYCQAYLAAAQAALRGGRPLERPDPAAPLCQCRVRRS
jgi:hypothetical protein